MEEEYYNVGIKRRNAALCVFFSIITLGIYAIYWFVCLTNDTNKLSRYKTAGGGMAILFSIITLGIYSIYWVYMLGKKAGDIDRDKSSGVAYLLLNIFLPGIGTVIAYCLAQGVLNRACDK